MQLRPPHPTDGGRPQGKGHRLTIAGLAFDVELLVMARRAGYEIREAGIVWYGHADSRGAVSVAPALFATASGTPNQHWLVGSRSDPT